MIKVRITQVYEYAIRESLDYPKECKTPKQKMECDKQNVSDSGMDISEFAELTKEKWEIIK